MDNGVTAQAGIIDAAQENITKNQVADMSLAEMNKKLYKITQLSIQASYEGKSYSDKKEIQDEIHKLRLEIQNAAHETNFNGENVFDSLSRKANSDKSVTGDERLEIERDQGVDANAQPMNKAGVYVDTTAPKVHIDYNAILNEVEQIDVTKQDGTKEALEAAKAKLIAKDATIERMTLAHEMGGRFDATNVIKENLCSNFLSKLSIILLTFSSVFILDTL